MYAIITLLQTEEGKASKAELRKQIRKAIDSTSLSKLWKVDHIAFLEEFSKETGHRTNERALISVD